MKLLRKIGEAETVLFILPALIPLSMFWLIPMTYIFYLSFTDWDFMNPVKHFVGLSNYADLLLNPDFYQSLRVTFTFAAGTVLPTMAGGLLLALLLHDKLAGSAVYRAILFSPWVTPTVAVSIVWAWIFEPRVGLANIILKALHLNPVPWLQNPASALVAVIIVTFWKGIGWTMVFYLVALQSVPNDLKESAQLDGANRIQSFFRITLPLISPTSFFLAIVLVIESLQAYDQISILTQGGPSGSTRTLLYMYYQSAFEQFNIGQASSVSVVLVFISIALSLSSIAVLKNRVHYLS